MSEESLFQPLSNSFCLLEWIHTFPNSNSIRNLSDLIHSSLLMDILKDLDFELYKELSFSQMYISNLALELSKYILKHISTSVLVVRQYSEEEIISKLLFVCVHCHKKENFIEKILNLDGEIQKRLMKMIEGVGNELAAAKEKKVILNKLADLQCQNQELVVQLIYQKKQSQKLKLFVQGIRTQYRLRQEDCEKFGKEESLNLRELQLQELNNYVCAYKKVVKQNQQFIKSIVELQEKWRSLDEQNKELKLKTIEDGLLIVRYQEDLVQLRRKVKKVKCLKSKSFGLCKTECCQSEDVGCGCEGDVVLLQEKMCAERQKYDGQIKEYDLQIMNLAKENKELRRMSWHLCGQMGQLQRIYRVVKEHVCG